MAKVPKISTKRVEIDKANTQMIAAVAGAAFVTIFCLVASRAVFMQNQYLARVTTAKEKANTQINDNLEAFKSLERSYKAFDSAGINIINGSRSGTGGNDGSNSKIVLNALPSSYDFPALASSIEKILKDNSVKIGSISGTDDQVNQQGNLSSAKPEPVPMQFSFTVENASYDSTKKLVAALGRSIRPIHIDSLDLSGGQNNLSVTINAHTYYQPAKNVNIKSEVVK